MKKAYIIIAHKNPRQLNRLIHRLSDGKSEFFLHIDKKVDISQFQSIAEVNKSIHFLNRFDAAWGSYGTIKPFLDGLQAVRDSPIGFDRVILLSGQDYPIKSNRDIDEFFERSPKSVFLNYFPIPDYERWPGNDRGGLYRVDKYYFGAQWYKHFASKTINLISKLFPALTRTTPYGMKPFIGQTWWILDSYAVDYILDFHNSHPEYIKFHKNTFVADEMFVQMIVGNSTDERLLQSIENNEKRFTIWKDITDAHPKILKKEDFEAIKASDDLFARKFDDEADAVILDIIDTNILLKDINLVDLVAKK